LTLQFETLLPGKRNHHAERFIVMSADMRTVKVLKRKGSPYFYLRYFEPRADGGWLQVWKSTKTTLKREAESARRSKERELEGGMTAPARLNWNELKEEFLEKRKDRTRPVTFATYRNSLLAFSRLYGDMLLTRIHSGTLEDFSSARLRENVRPTTVNKELRHVRIVLRWAERRKYITSCPRFTEAFIRLDKRHPVVMPEKDFNAIIQAIPKAELSYRSAEWWKVFLYLAYFAGLRRGELLGLAWNKVDLEKKHIVVTYDTTKGRKDRNVPIHAGLVSILKEWKGKSGPNQGYVLHWPHDGIRSLYVDWHAIQNAAGIQGTEHYVPKNCRSSCASLMIAAGVPTAVVKDFLGHEHITTTEEYYCNTAPALRSAADARPVTDVKCSTPVANATNGE
jgi:integrase